MSMQPSQHGQAQPDAPAPPRTAQETRRLQDYQMQMMLNQQQAQRIRMAREAQQQVESISPGLSPSSPSTAEPRSSKRKLVHLLNDTAAEPQEVVGAHARAETGDRDGDGHDLALASGDATAGTADPSGLPYVVLYRAVCSSGHRKCNGRTYQDRPHVAVVDGEPHLAGTRPVLDPGSLLAARNNPTAFVVYRESYCADGGATHPARPSTSPPGAEPVRDIIFVVSEQLQGALQRLSRFAPDDGSYEDGCSPRSQSLQLSGSPSEYSRYFFYHHRDALHQAVTTDPCGGEVKCLLSHLLDHPDPMYAKCDTLFNQGLVTSETSPWLFQPNEIVVCNSGLLETAYVLSSVGGGSDCVKLVCWNWGYDGRWLRRKEATVAVTSPKAAPAPITKLAVYPLRHADERTRLRLFERGNRFWALRNQTHVSYEGPDYDGENIYVGFLFFPRVPFKSGSVLTGRPTLPVCSLRTRGV